VHLPQIKFPVSRRRKLNPRGIEGRPHQSPPVLDDTDTNYYKNLLFK
jgi:hypothetical protein